MILASGKIMGRTNLPTLSGFSWRKLDFRVFRRIGKEMREMQASGVLTYNKSLQLTIDPAGALAVARPPSASIAAERRR